MPCMFLIVPSILPFIGVMFFGYGHDFVYAIWNVIADMLVTVFQGFFCKVVDSFITDCAYMCRDPF